jgi:rubrerythrin
VEIAECGMASGYLPPNTLGGLVAEFAAEEKEHLGLLQEWMDKTESSVDEQPFDFDPANMPE